MSLFSQPVQRRRRCDVNMAQYVVFCDGQRVYYGFPLVWRGPKPVLSYIPEDFSRVESLDDVLGASIDEPRIYIPSAWNRPWASPDDDDPRDLVCLAGELTRFGGPLISSHGWKGRLEDPGRDLLGEQISLEGWAFATAELQSVARADLVVYRFIRYEAGREIVLPFSKANLAALTFDVDVPCPVQLMGDTVAIASGVAVNEKGAHTGYARGAVRIPLAGGELQTGSQKYSLKQSGYVSSWDAIEAAVSNGVIQREPWV